MRLETINKLCCPFDKEDLTLSTFTKDLENNIIEGMLTCNHCKRYYPIVCGIPIMSPDEYRENKLEAPIVDKWEKQLTNTSPKDFKLVEKN